MRFVQFIYNSKGKPECNLGVDIGDNIVDLSGLGVNNLIDFIKGGNELMTKAKRYY